MPTEFDDGDSIDTDSQGTLIIGTTAVPGTAHPISVDSSGQLNVNVVSSVAGGGGTEVNDGTATDTDTDGPLIHGTTGVPGTAHPMAVDGSGHPQVDVVTSALPTGAATAANQTTANTSLGIMDDWDNAASDGASVSGDVAHDTADAGEPVKIGYKAIAHGASPTAVAANDRTDAYANRHGIPFMIGGHPNVETWTDENTAAGSNEVLKTVNSSQKAVITMVEVFCDNANTVDVDVLLEFDDTADVFVAHHPGIAPGSGFVIGDGSGIVAIGGDAQDVIWTNEVPTGGSVRITVRGYIIPS